MAQGYTGAHFIDFTQFLLLAGRTGTTNDPTINSAGTAKGTINGSSQASGILKLQSTSNATKGNIRLVDPVVIGTDAANTTSTILDLESTTGALLLPSMTTTQRNALTGSDGFYIYNNSINRHTLRSASTWMEVGSTLDRSTALVANTSTVDTQPKTMYSVSIPANLLSTVNGLHLKAAGTIAKNVVNNITFSVLYGANTLTTTSAITLTSSATSYNWWLDLFLIEAGTTNSQKASMYFVTSLDAAANTNVQQVVDQVNNNATDSTSAFNLLIRTTWSSTANAATANLDMAYVTLF